MTIWYYIVLSTIWYIYMILCYTNYTADENPYEPTCQNLHSCRTAQWCYVTCRGHDRCGTTPWKTKTPLSLWLKIICSLNRMVELVANPIGLWVPYACTPVKSFCPANTINLCTPREALSRIPANRLNVTIRDERTRESDTFRSFIQRDFRDTEYLIFSQAFQWERDQSLLGTGSGTTGDQMCCPRRRKLNWRLGMRNFRNFTKFVCR